MIFSDWPWRHWRQVRGEVHCWRMTKDERVRAFDFFHDPVL